MRRRKRDTREEDANRGILLHPPLVPCEGGEERTARALCGNGDKNESALRRLRAADLRTSPTEFMAVVSFSSPGPPLHRSVQLLFERVRARVWCTADKLAPRVSKNFGNR